MLCRQNLQDGQCPAAGAMKNEKFYAFGYLDAIQRATNDAYYLATIYTFCDSNRAFSRSTSNGNLIPEFGNYV